MAKTDKKGIAKKKDLTRAQPASSKDILAKAERLTKPTFKKGQTAVTSEESSSDSDSDEGKDNITPATAQTAPAKRLVKGASDSDSSDASSSEESSSDESDEEKDNTTPVTAQTPPTEGLTKESSSDSSDASSSEESSSDSDSDGEEDDNPPVTAKNSSVKGSAKQISDFDSSDASSSESSSGSDSDEKDDITPVPTKTASAEANKKRKADSEAAAPPKKAKLTDSSASAVTSSEETKSIFVGRLSWNVDNDWLAQEFAECGEVESAHVQTDRNTGRSRGFGYVHFTTAEAVEKALALNGKEIDGRPVNIDRSSNSDKKASFEKRAKAFGDTPSPPSAVLFVGNLSFGVNEDTLWETFGEHGDIKSIRVPTDRETGRPKGFAYVEFSEVDAAKTAYETLQGHELDGRSVRLDFSQPRDSVGGARGGQGGRGGRGRGFGGDRGRGRGRGRGDGRGGRGGDRGGRGRGGVRTGGIAQFEGQKITF